MRFFTEVERKDLPCRRAVGTLVKSPAGLKFKEGTMSDPIKGFLILSEEPPNGGYPDATGSWPLPLTGLKVQLWQPGCTDCPCKGHWVDTKITRILAEEHEEFWDNLAQNWESGGRKILVFETEDAVSIGSTHSTWDFSSDEHGVTWRLPPLKGQPGLDPEQQDSFWEWLEFD